MRLAELNRLAEDPNLWDDPQKAQKLMQSALKTEVRARYPLQNAPEAVTEYETQMTGGKVLLTVSS